MRIPFQKSNMKINTFLIAQCMNIKGGLEGSCSGRIEGHVLGDVKIRGKVILDHGGKVDGHLMGEDLVVNGQVKGNVVGARSVELGPEANVSGHIVSYSIRIHPLAHVGGKLLKKDDILDLDKFNLKGNVDDRPSTTGLVVKIIKPETAATQMNQVHQSTAEGTWW